MDGRVFHVAKWGAKDSPPSKDEVIYVVLRPGYYERYEFGTESDK